MPVLAWDSVRWGHSWGNPGTILPTRGHNQETPNGEWSRCTGAQEYHHSSHHGEIMGGKKMQQGSRSPGALEARVRLQSGQESDSCDLWWHMSTNCRLARRRWCRAVCDVDSSQRAENWARGSLCASGKVGGQGYGDGISGHLAKGCGRKQLCPKPELVCGSFSTYLNASLIHIWWPWKTGRLVLAK